MSRETKAQQAQREQASEYLREYVQPGQKVYALVTKVARSGMSRTLRFFVLGVQPKPEAEHKCVPLEASDVEPTIHDVTHLVARIYGSEPTRDGLRVGGCGFDAASHVLDLVSSRLGESYQDVYGPSESRGYGPVPKRIVEHRRLRREWL